MTDLLSDPRVNDLLLARPAEIATLADYFRRAAEESISTATGLRAAQHDGIWHGEAAEAFRHAIGRMPGRLDSLHAGFRDAGAALSAYEAALNRIQAAFGQVIGAIQSWSAELGPARAAADTARIDLRQLLNRPGIRSSVILAAIQDVERAEGRLGDITDVVGRLHRSAWALLDEFEHQRTACRSQIAVARQLAPAPPLEVRLRAPTASDLAPST